MLLERSVIFYGSSHGSHPPGQFFVWTDLEAGVSVPVLFLCICCEPGDSFVKAI